jgi:hypothetical protein
MAVGDEKEGEEEEDFPVSLALEHKIAPFLAEVFLVNTPFSSLKMDK